MRVPTCVIHGTTHTCSKGGFACGEFELEWGWTFRRLVNSHTPAEWNLTRMIRAKAPYARPRRPFFPSPEKAQQDSPSTVVEYERLPR